MAMGVHLLILTTYPAVFIDEGWFSNAAWHWARTGVNFDPMHAGVLDQFGYVWIRRFFLGQAPWSLMFSLFGVGFFQARLTAWLIGAALVGITVAAGKQLYSARVGLLAALLLAISWPFAQASHYARQDILLTLVVLVAFVIAVYALRRERWWAHVLAGFLLGISPDIHQNGMAFIPALAALYLTYYGRSLLMKRGTWLAALGGGAGLLIFAVVHILPSPETYSLLFSFDFGSTGNSALPITNPTMLPQSIVGEFSRFRFFDNNLDLALIAGAGVYLLLRRDRADNLLLTYTGAALVGFMLVIGNKTTLYAILLYPFFMLVIAGAFVSLLRERDRAYRALVMVLLVVFIGKSMLFIAKPAYASRNYDYHAITERIKTVTPVGARVMALPGWWLGLNEYDFRSFLSLAYYRFFNDYSVEEAMEQLRPDILVLDHVTELLAVPDGKVLEGSFDHYKVSRDELSAFLNLRGEVVLEFDDPWHDRFTVYRINWNDGAN